MATDRITIDPQVMGGKPCIRGMRVTVGMIVGMLAEGHAAAVSVKPVHGKPTTL